MAEGCVIRTTIARIELWRGFILSRARRTNMAKYYVNTNAQPTGEHEVHTTNCPHPPDPSNRRQLGEHSTCQSAVRQARTIFDHVDGCAYCVPECHSR